MAANNINEIYGVLNGTTNYILTEMEKNGAAFSDALLDAQKKGYAESDPTADIEGHDTCRKICILSSLAFGQHVLPRQVPTEGITGVTIDDMHCAQKLGYRIKLLGRVRAVGDKISVYVAPHLVSKHTVLADIDNVINAVVIRGNVVGDIVFCGAGAGKLPTASAVVADIVDVAKHLHTRRWISWSEGCDSFIVDPILLDSAWYIRTEATREKIEKEFGHVVFADDTAPETAFITGVMNGKMVNDLLSRGITAKSQFRILGDY
jgi:homoserine dehydrogenase